MATVNIPEEAQDTSLQVIPKDGEKLDFFISKRAAERINELVEKEEAGSMFRISVLGGGCSGFQYNFAFDTTQNDDDYIFEHDGAKVIIDVMSIDFIKGSMLDFAESLGASLFEIKNPNATANCGCGSSFSV